MIDDEEAPRTLRGAVYRQDTRATLDVLTTIDLGDRLQLAGTGVLIALGQDRTAAEPFAHRLLDALSDRQWDGDEELAAELHAALGTGPTPPLKDVPVPLSELADAMDTNDYGGRINLQDGDVVPAVLFNYDPPEDLADEDFADADRWLGIDPAGSRAGWSDMADFIDTVADERCANRLAVAIEGRGAYRRFKDVLHRWPAEVARWYALSEDRRLGRAREWLAGEGFRAARF